MDVYLKIQLHMVRDRFIDGQADSALHRHLDSLGPNTPMIEMVDSCRIWERHCEPEIRPRMGADRCPVHMTCQVTKDSLGDGVRGRHDQKTVADAGTSAFTGGPEIFRWQLMETICPPTNDLETPSFNRFPVGTVTEEDIAQPELLSDSTEGCFS